MSEFIRAIEFDQTPTKAAMQWSSELAEQANRNAQLSMTMQKMQAEREKALFDKYGDYVNKGVDLVKGMNGEVVNSLMEGLKKNLGAAIAQSKGDPGVFTMLGFEKGIKSLISDKAAAEQILSMGEELAKQKEAMGFDPRAIRAATARYASNIGAGLDPNKFVQDIEAEISDNPSVYGDPAKQLNILKSVKDIKGEAFEREVTVDPTGTLKRTIAVKADRKPWESLIPFKGTNGVSTEIPSIKIEVIKTPDGSEEKSVTKSVYDGFLSVNPAAAPAVMAGAKDIVHSVNSKNFGVDTRSMSRSEFEAAKKAKPELIDPFNSGILDVYGKRVVTKLLASDYDENGLRIPDQLKEFSVKDNPPKAPTVNINTGEQGFIDQFEDIKKAVETGKQVRVKGKPVGTPLNMLDSGQDYLIDIANKAGGKTEDGTQRYNQENLILKKTPEGKIGLYQWDKDNSTVGDLVSIVSRRSTNVKANQPLGTKAKQAAAGVAKPKTLAEQMREQANKK